MVLCNCIIYIFKYYINQPLKMLRNYLVPPVLTSKPELAAGIVRRGKKFGGRFFDAPSDQWIFQVPVKGGRDYISPLSRQYISGIYCQLGYYMPPTTF